MSSFTSICMALADWLMRDRHSEWSRAMNAELAHVRESERTQWALGCLIAALRQRFAPMHTDSLRISPWVLSLELTACFVPITFGWADTVFGTSGVIHLNSAIIAKFFLDTPLSTAVLAMTIAGAIVGIIGPIGLLLTLQAVRTGTGMRNRTLALIMLVSLGSYGLASMGLRLIAGPGAYAATLDFIVLIIVLPMLGIAHLMHWTHPVNTRLAAA